MATVKVCLDAGHYGKYNQSPVVKAYYESDMVWKLHLLLKEELERYDGFKVSVTRNDQNKDLALYSRGKASKGCDLFISLHSNACATESVDRPVGIYLVEDSGSDIDEKSQKVAVLLANVVAEVMATNDKAKTYSKLSSTDRDGDGKKNDDYYGVLHGAHQVGTPGIILEHSFHTNTRAAKWLLKDENLAKLAEAEAKALAEHYGLRLKEAVVEAKPKELYRVRKAWNNASSQIGAYTVLANAVEACKAGYKVYNSSGKVVYTPDADRFEPYTVRIKIKDLYIRKGAGTNYKTNGFIKPGVYTIVAESSGKGSVKGWGKLKSGAGWVSLDYCTKTSAVK